MLGKLMKYEIKATARTLIPLYIALLAFAIINKIFIGTGLADKLEGFRFNSFYTKYFCIWMYNGCSIYSYIFCNYTKIL